MEGIMLRITPSAVGARHRLTGRKNKPRRVTLATANPRRGRWLLRGRQVERRALYA
jgi:hypothetical protein